MEQQKRKTRRFIRSPEKVPFRFQPETDAPIIKMVYDYRFINGQQITAVLNRSGQTVSKRLKKLFHHYYLERIDPREQRTDPSEHIVYALYDEGARVLVNYYEKDRAEIKWKREYNEIGISKVRHALMVSQCRACLTAALKNHPEAELWHWVSEYDLPVQYVYTKGEDYPKKLPIVPDSYFILRLPDCDKHFFLEADRGTMSNVRFLNKMRAYWWMWHQTNYGGLKNKFEVSNFRVLSITETEQRKENLRAITKQADRRGTGSAMFYFARQDSYDLNDPETILKEIWQSPKDESWHRILE